MTLFFTVVHHFTLSPNTSEASNFLISSPNTFIIYLLKKIFLKRAIPYPTPASLHCCVLAYSSGTS